MRQGNHCSSSKGIPKMKFQASEPSDPETLQSQTRPCPKNRLSISRLGVVHGRLTTCLAKLAIDADRFLVQRLRFLGLAVEQAGGGERAQAASEGLGGA